MTQRFPPAIGGVEDHVLRLSAHLRAAGNEVAVVTTDLARDQPFQRFSRRELPAEGSVHRHRAIAWGPLPHGLGIAAPGMVLDTITVPADLLHAHAFGYCPTWAATLRRAMGRGPVVVTPHSDQGRPGRVSSLYARGVARWTLRRADGVIALTEGERVRLEHLGVPPARIRVIPNGIDLDEFAGATPVGPPRGGFRILFVGRLYSAQKGLDTLADAFARLGPPAELRLVGEDWGGLGSFFPAGRPKDSSARITVLGRLSRGEVLAEYQRADVVVLPSRFEPFGIVLLEAMASRRPVVASRVGGIPEVVDDGRTGRLVPPDDPRQLAEALRELRADPGLGARWGEEGRRRVERYSWETLTPRFLGLFRELLEGRNQPG